ncbi:MULTISPECIES: DUF885 family protein [unclassified Streptomyces]|uniref:DUF885 family protein n=1 Tax=unclassified Streptomyces TaxID=2593676 RepID=UPI002E2ADA2A|nr:DUF885 family protein [Streptomyces sp. NBC_00223]
MAELFPRLRHVCDLDAAYMREYSGLHDEYDGTVVDLSPAGVTTALAALGGPVLDDPHDEAQLAATENAMRTRFGRLRQHRWDPWVHIEALDLSPYDRPYTDAGAREDARRRHLRLWPDTVDNALEALDELSSPVASMFLPAARGMAAEIRPDDGEDGRRALAALERLTAHLERAARDGDPAPSLGRADLTALLGCEDRVDVDLDELAAMADSEYARMRDVLDDAAARLDPDGDADPAERTRRLSARVRADHGDFPRILADTQAQVALAASFVRERELVPTVDDACLVEPSPPARSWAPGRVSWTAPWETQGHSLFHVTGPAAHWSPDDHRAWLSRFNRPAMAVMAVHEIGPGHCSHALMMGQVARPVRRTLWSELFFEGWAHYAEEMMWEEGYQDDSPLYQFGMAQEAMMRAVRVQAALGIHTGALTVADAVALFENKAFLAGPAARAEALRGVWEPTYIRYTWGKVLMRRLREQAKAAWGSDFGLPRFHRELMAFGSPPVGLVADAMGIGPAPARRPGPGSGRI